MKQSYTSSKENKEDLKIKFEDFPGDKNKSTIKNKIYIFLIVIVVLFLFISSSILNEIVLYGNSKNDYNVVNEFDGNYAVVKAGQRDDLLEKIGFDSSSSRTEQKDDKTYQTSYAIKKTEDENLLDSISVYYDDNEKVSYVILNLFYVANDFSISKVVIDCNSIINNYVNIKTNKNMISEAKSNGYYYYKDKDTNIKASYMLQKNGGYYMLSVNVGD